ncbi:methionine ABC transporter ATP-binding protein [Brochothrix thermosphacta]|uniref:Methionine ABC transporter (ATP-binding protein) n=1 Tax=Brochothrix thermosphacta TaxID=2756 RepID=A0A2X0RZC7_BROTH|nr:methionine ABC transporter ATP-binding protein [Brochothrix thermosphacta]SPP25606.1 methionine ABC transporter (ATP-binding protein) [Brochothrix thermosphacta]
MIKLDNVSKTFETRNGAVNAVKDVNLEINEGEIFGIIGYSGAGKSTLIRMFNGLEAPTQGAIHINDVMISDVKGAALRAARQKIGMIFQHFNLLWSRTVAENIAFPLEIAGVKKAERERRVAELIHLVGLDGRDKSYPSQLSGGQKQRVGIARALANDPDVLLCDEATSALDPQTTSEVLNLLTDINKRLGLTIILITHEMPVIRKICNRVAVMEGGEVVELGDVLSVFQTPQQEITRRFVSQATDDTATEEVEQLLIETYPTGLLARLVFNASQATQPIITDLSKKFNLDISILHGSITQTQNGSYGFLFIQIVAEQEQIIQTKAYLEEIDVRMEVIRS